MLKSSPTNRNLLQREECSMNHADKQMISLLASDLQSNTTPVDKEANVFIQEQIGKDPDAIYKLTQAVLLQKQAIEQLQAQVKNIHQQLQQNSNNQGNGFLGNMFGNRSRQSVPPSESYAPPRRAFGQGSFLGSALTTAAGVAGGMFLFEGIKSMFDSGSATESMTSADALTNQPSFLGDFQGQEQLLDDGFGNGDSFLDDSGSGGDFGGGMDDDWLNNF